jgi:hypothetical protein
MAKTFAGSFTQTIAIEPNTYLLNQLRQALPAVEAIELPIMEAQPTAQGEFVLCSHTLYYIPAKDWLAHIERLVSWMAPGGVTVLVLQHRESGCMNMLHHFFGHRFELRQTMDTFRAKHGGRYEVTITMDPAHVETPDLAKTNAVAEFMLNLLGLTNPPTQARRGDLPDNALRAAERQFQDSRSTRNSWRSGMAPSVPANERLRGSRGPQRRSRLATRVTSSPGRRTKICRGRPSSK